MAHDYKRYGTTTLFAALSVLDGSVIGRCMQRHRHLEFIHFRGGRPSMGGVTKIEWCHHTFNPWWGCTQVSPLCDRCYAMMIDARWFKRRHWGSRASRRYFPDAYWAQPPKWDYLADVAGCRRRVFCASMADVFDKAADPAVRDRLWQLVRRTPNLDWLLLTKRIGNAAGMLPADWGDGYPNVWLIVSVDQAALKRDVPKLLAIPAVVHGISIEPQLAPIRLGKFARLLQWVINGGESGAGSRPFHVEWARTLAAECKSAATPMFIQRLGSRPHERSVRLRLNDRAGGDWSEWPSDLRIREFPEVPPRSY
jgi:protein gp37